LAVIPSSARALIGPRFRPSHVILVHLPAQKVRKLSRSTRESSTRTMTLVSTRTTKIVLAIAESRNCAVMISAYTTNWKDKTYLTDAQQSLKTAKVYYGRSLLEQTEWTYMYSNFGDVYTNFSGQVTSNLRRVPSSQCVDFRA